MQKLCFDIRKHKNSIAAAPQTPFCLCLFSLFGVFFEAVFVIGILQKVKVFKLLDNRFEIYTLSLSFYKFEGSAV